MKQRDLVSSWSAPDNSRLTAKQVSLRFPVHVAARIAALCEMYPRKTRTEIIGDLLAVALEGVQAQFPEVRGEFLGEDPDTHKGQFLAAGTLERFRQLTNRHYRELEKELGNESPEDFFRQPFVIEVDPD